MVLPPGHPPLGAQGGSPGLTSPADLLDAVKVREVTREDVRKLDLPANTAGVQVTAVAPDSAAANKLLPGDVVETVNQEAVWHFGQLRPADARRPGGSAVGDVHHPQPQSHVGGHQPGIR